MKVWLGRGTSQNTSAQARAPLQRLHVGTHSRPIIQQDRSSEAIVSAISQLHLLSVLLAILESSGLRGPASNRINPAGPLRLHLLFVLLALLHRGGRSSKHPSESIQQGQCVCIITLALAARPDGVFAPHSPILLRTFHGYDGPALQHGQSSSCPPCCSYVFRLREYLQEAITPCSAAKHAT